MLLEFSAGGVAVGGHIVGLALRLWGGSGFRRLASRVECGVRGLTPVDLLSAALRVAWPELPPDLFAPPGVRNWRPGVEPGE